VGCDHAYAICLYLKVKVTIRDSPDSPEITIRELGKGDFFGEKALLGDSIRTANIIATSAVSCLTVDKE